MSECPSVIVACTKYHTFKNKFNIGHELCVDSFFMLPACDLLKKKDFSHLHNVCPCCLPLCRCNPVCNQCRSQLTEADCGQAGAGGAVEVQAQRRVPDCQRQRGPAAILPDWKTYLTETNGQKERQRVGHKKFSGVFFFFF